jgi:hypothetical protein
VEGVAGGVASAADPTDVCGVCGVKGMGGLPGVLLLKIKIKFFILVLTTTPATPKIA